jgi:hypothetical protein
MGRHRSLRCTMRCRFTRPTDRYTLVIFVLSTARTRPCHEVSGVAFSRLRQGVDPSSRTRVDPYRNIDCLHQYVLMYCIYPFFSE